MNRAGDSNIPDIATEERVRKLVNEYVLSRVVASSNPADARFGTSAG